MPPVTPPRAVPIIKTNTNTKSRPKTPPVRAGKDIPNATKPGAASPGTSKRAIPRPQDTPINVLGLQRSLKSQGYDLALTGKLDPVTKSALRDFLQPDTQHPLSSNLAAALKGGAITGFRDPKAWSTRFGVNRKTKKVEKPLTGPGGQLDNNGNLTDPKGLKAKAGDHIDLSGLSAAAGDPMTPYAESLAKRGASLLDLSDADKMAGLEYDSQIRDANIALQRAGRQAPQNQRDIKDWYGQVLGSQATAAQRDKAIGAAAVASDKNATAAILSSIGGSANEGAGVVGAAGDQAVGTQQALGSIQDQYNSDIVPILNSERAGQLVRQRNIDLAHDQDLEHQIGTLRGQRGQAVDVYRGQLQDKNNTILDNRADRLFKIKEANNAMTQQGFNNTLALAQARIAALMAGLKIQTAGGKNQGGSKGLFLNSTPSTKAAAFQTALGSLYDPVTHQRLNLTPQQQATRVMGVIQGYGWTPANPSVKAFIQNVLTTYANAG